MVEPRELISSDTNRGYAGGNNLGIARALTTGAKYLLLLNSDAAIEEQSVGRMLDRMEANPDIAILGPVIREQGAAGGEHCFAGGKDIAWNALTRTAAVQNSRSDDQVSSLQDVDYVPGAVFLVRASLFERTNLLDERFFFSGEIADLCKRARDCGSRVCVDLAAQARHDTQQTPKTLRETLYVYYSLRNRLLYAKKHYPDQMTRFFGVWLKLCLTEFARAAAKGNLRKARAVVVAVLHGCRNRFGNQHASFI
jgi:GT2 family glycosyltransferase